MKGEILKTEAFKLEKLEKHHKSINNIENRFHSMFTFTFRRLTMLENTIIFFLNRQLSFVRASWSMSFVIIVIKMMDFQFMTMCCFSSWAVLADVSKCGQSQYEPVYHVDQILMYFRRKNASLDIRDKHTLYEARVTGQS